MMLFFRRRPLRRLTNIFLVLLLITFSTAKAQQSVSIGDTQVKANAVLYLRGTGTQGLIIPIVGSNGTFGEQGMLVFNATDKKLYYHNGTAWVDASGSTFTEVDGVIGNEVSQVNTGRGGLEITGSGTNASPLSIGLIQGTTDGQILKWNNTTKKWELGTIAATDNQDLSLTGTTLSLTNDGTSVTLGGLAILNTLGSLEITDGAISNADIANAAAIAVSKLAAGSNGQVLTVSAGIPSWQTPAIGATTLDGLTDATVTTPTGGQVLVNDGAGQFKNVSVSGDVAITAAGAATIQAGAISGGVGGKITDASITSADLAAGSVSGGAAGVITDASITAADLANGAVTATKLANTTVTAGSYGTATQVPQFTVDAQGRITAASNVAISGVTTLDGLSDATVTTPTGGQILVNDGAGQFKNVSVSGDIAITAAGAATIQAGAVSGGVGGKITDASITSADLAAGSVSGGAAGVITDGTIVNADVSNTAAIAGTKISPDFGTQNITTTGKTVFNTVQYTWPNAQGLANTFLKNDGAGNVSWSATPTPFSTLNVIPKGDGTGLIASQIFDDGVNVGIGTTTPAYLLDVNKTLTGGADANIRVYNPSNTSGDKSGIRFGVGSFWAVHLQTALNGNWLELTNNSGTAYHTWDFDSYHPGNGTGYIQGTGGNLALMGGNVGIGITAPLYPLDVGGSMRINGYYYFNDGTNIFHVSGSYSGINDHWIPNLSNTYDLGTTTWRWRNVYLNNNPNVSSDSRLKKDVIGLTYGLPEVMKLRPVSYKLISDAEQKTKLGFIAQEVKQIIPEIVTEDNSKDKYLGMSYSELIPVLINAIQEQQKTIELLKARLTALQTKNDTETGEMKAELAEIKRMLNLEANKK